jgi:hypothetical protein
LRNFESEIPPSNECGYLLKDHDGHVGFFKDDIPYDTILKKGKKILEFIEECKSVCIVGKPLKTENKLPPSLLKLIRSKKIDFDLDVIEYGYISKCSIMLENSLFRQLFNSFENSPKAFCIVDYLLFLVSKNKITTEKYCKSLSLLLKHNYACLPFNCQILFYLIENNGFLIDEHITYIFDELFTEIYDKQSICYCMVDTIILLWSELLPSEVKYKWTDYLVKKLVHFNNLTPRDLHIMAGTISTLIYNMKSRKDFQQYFENFEHKYQSLPSV